VTGHIIEILLDGVEGLNDVADIDIEEEWQSAFLVLTKIKT
jgi:hypothetical protein